MAKSKCTVKITGFYMEAEGDPEVIRAALQQATQAIFGTFLPESVEPVAKVDVAAINKSLRRRRPTPA